MASRSIGSLFIDVEARTAKLEADMVRLKGTLAGTKNDVAAVSGQLIQGFAGAEAATGKLLLKMVVGRSAIAFLAHEFKNVAENVQDIPGLPSRVVTSVQELAHNLSQARQGLDVLIAHTEAGFADFAKAVGAGIASFVYGEDAMTEGLKAELESLEDLAAEHDKAYGEHVRQAMKNLAEEKKTLARASDTEAQKIVALRKEDELWSKFARTNSITRLQSIEAEINAVKKRTEADSKMHKLQEDLQSAEKKVNETTGLQAFTNYSAAESVEVWTQKVWKLRYELSQMERADPKNSDPAIVEQKIKANKAIATAQEKLNSALARQKDLYKELGTSISQDFGQAILQGESLHDLLGTLLQDILKIILQKTILGPLADFMSTGLSSFFTGHAMGGPINGPSIVGENGPELFVPNGAGTVIPNEQLGKGGGAGNNFFIDARGADQAAIQQLEQKLYALAGPGMVERRAVAATIGTMWRRGAAGRALQGA